MVSRTRAGGETDRPAVLDPRDENGGRPAVVEAWLALQDALCFQPARATEWLAAERGDARRALAGAPVEGGRPGRCELARRRRLLARLGVLVVPQLWDGYPPALRLIPDPPPVLLVRGRLEVLHRPAVAVVGARAATTYGLDIARRLGAGLARSGAVVVSGLARGIDAAAHEGALEAGGATVAVLACGPDVVYPPEHARLAERVAAAGAVVTELPPGCPPLRYHFPLRNRVISGLSRGVVVVEARAKSGSLITARHALDQGREVMAVPGPVTAAASAGPNALLRDGARPVVELRDAIETFGLRASPARAGGSGAAGTAALPEPEDPEAARLLALVREAPATREQLQARLGWSPRELALRLLELEMAGLAVADRDGRLRAVMPGAP